MLPTRMILILSTHEFHRTFEQRSRQASKGRMGPSCTPSVLQRHLGCPTRPKSSSALSGVELRRRRRLYGDDRRGRKFLCDRLVAANAPQFYLSGAWSAADEGRITALGQYLHSKPRGARVHLSYSACISPDGSEDEWRPTAGRFPAFKSHQPLPEVLGLQLASIAFPGPDSWHFELRQIGFEEVTSSNKSDPLTIPLSVASPLQPSSSRSPTMDKPIAGWGSAVEENAKHPAGAFLFMDLRSLRDSNCSHK